MDCSHWEACLSKNFPIVVRRRLRSVRGCAMSVVPALTLSAAIAPLVKSFSQCLPCSWRQHQQCALRQRQWQSCLPCPTACSASASGGVQLLYAFCRICGASCRSACSASARGRLQLLFCSPLPTEPICGPEDMQEPTA